MDRNWTGTVSGDATVAGNWDTGVPVDGDNVYINAGNRVITGDLSAIEPALMRIGPLFTGSFGTNGSNPFKIAPVKLTYSGGGDAEGWFQLGAAAITRATIA